MKNLRNIYFVLSILMLTTACSVATSAHSDEMMKHNKIHTNDGRLSLGLSPEMKQHLLSNMRAHVEIIQSIVGLLSNGEFDKASQIAHSKLGLTDENRKMCNMFDNEKFKNLGLTFHKSADDLGDALQTKDINKSLSALHITMGYCVQCHATFRQ